MNDPLARRLKVLMQHGSLASSKLSKRARDKLSTLFDAGILVEEPAGAGHRVLVRSTQGLKNWIARRYPHGLDGHGATMSGRVEAVANHRDSKVSTGLDASLVHLRGFGNSELRRGEEQFPVAELTKAFGAASLLVRQDCSWRLSGRLCTVENLEVFLRIEELLDDVDLAIYTGGRLSGLVISWLANCCGEDSLFLHVGDYDPVGLAEYLRLTKQLGGRVNLYLPDDLEERLIRYGNTQLLRQSRKLQAVLRRSDDPTVRTVVELIDRHGRCLEQEALLIPETNSP